MCAHENNFKFSNNRLREGRAYAWQKSPMFFFFQILTRIWQNWSTSIPYAVSPEFPATMGPDLNWRIRNETDSPFRHRDTRPAAECPTVSCTGPVCRRTQNDTNMWWHFRRPNDIEPPQQCHEQTLYPSATAQLKYQLKEAVNATI